MQKKQEKNQDFLPQKKAEISLIHGVNDFIVNRSDETSLQKKLIIFCQPCYKKQHTRYKKQHTHYENDKIAKRNVYFYFKGNAFEWHRASGRIVTHLVVIINESN